MAEQTAQKPVSQEQQTDEEPAGRAGEPAPADGPGPRPMSAGRRRAAAAVSVLGELLITGGLVLGLFVVYSLWWTNVVANQEAAQESEEIRDRWEAAAPGDAQGPESAPAYNPEDGIGFLHVPTMSGDDILVKEGTDLDILNGGVAGSYTEPVEADMPWEGKGNFSLAAHRDGHGAKFHAIDRIEEGDPIVFETRDTWYVYRVYALLPETSKFNIEVLNPVPGESGRTKAGRYITLTTCTPMYTSRYRYIVWGELERTEPVDEQRTPPAELRQHGNGAA